MQGMGRPREDGYLEPLEYSITLLMKEGEGGVGGGTSPVGIDAGGSAEKSVLENSGKSGSSKTAGSWGDVGS